MFFDFLKRKSKIIEVDEDGNVKNVRKKSRWLVLLIISAIVLLVFSGNGENKSTESEKIPQKGGEAFQTAEYKDGIEEELEGILSTIKGAGRVGVMVTLSEYGEKVLASDKKKELETENEEKKTRRNSLEEETAILYGAGAAEAPFILKEKLPMPSGVLVVAEGAGDESVRLEIYEAVKALYGISGHRIKIALGLFK